MRGMCLKMKIVVITIAILMTTVSSAWAQDAYKYTEILPPDWWSSDGRGINSRGAVVGDGYDGQLVRKGFLYERGKFTELVPPGCIDIYAMAINDYSDVVGDCCYADCDFEGKVKGFMYRKGKYTFLLPPGWVYAYAVSINNDGSVVGYGAKMVDEYSYLTMGFLYRNGSYTELILDENRETWATAINNYGVVAGSWYNYYPSNTYDVFFYTNGEYTSFPPPSGFVFAYTEDINENGVAAGWVSTDEPYNEKGFILSEGSYTLLSVPGTVRTRANAINNKGEAVGFSDVTLGQNTGFVYSNGVYTEIGPPVGTNTDARDINDNGVIVGSVAGFRAFIATKITPKRPRPPKP